MIDCVIDAIIYFFPDEFCYASIGRDAVRFLAWFFGAIYGTDFSLQRSQNGPDGNFRWGDAEPVAAICAADALDNSCSPKFWNELL